MDSEEGHRMEGAKGAPESPNKASTTFVRQADESIMFDHCG